MKLILKILCVALLLGCGNSKNKSNHKDYPPITYEASWESLKRVPIPDWFENGKFGIFIHWGPYSVPGWIPPGRPGYSEHFPSNMYRDTDTYNPFLQERFGDTIPNIGYKDMIPLFKAEKFDANEWAKLFKEAGATYVIPVAEHHDGFAMWDSEITDWNAAKMGPKRDIIGELAVAVRNYDMKFGVSYHRERHYAYYCVHKNVGGGPLPAIQEEIKRMPEAKGLYGPFEMNTAYMEDYLARWREICDKYQPDFCWMDGLPAAANEKDKKIFYTYIKKMLAEYVNRANKEWGKQVYFNNKGNKDSKPEGVGVRGKDNLSFQTISPRWQNPASLGRSYGYYGFEDKYDLYKPSKELVHLLIETVSKNGNLLLNVGPRADGTIPENQQKRLRDIGRWLKQNGEAIYNTRPWKACGEGRARFTTNGNKLYVIMLDWPDKNALELRSFEKWTKDNIKNVRLLGGTDIKWDLDERGLRFSLPKEPKGKYAYVIEVTCNADLSALPVSRQKIVFEDLHQKHKKRFKKMAAEIRS